MPSGRLPSQKSKWYLPPNTYQMVQYMCLSYFEMQQKAMDIQAKLETIGQIKGQCLDGMPHGTDITDPTERLAEEKLRLDRELSGTLWKISLIEKAVDKTTFSFRKQLLWAVTNRSMTYERLRGLHGMPVSKNIFGKMKQEVYWRIAQEL